MLCPYNHVVISICSTMCRAIYDLCLGCVTLACAAFVPSLFLLFLLCINCTSVTAVHELYWLCFCCPRPTVPVYCSVTALLAHSTPSVTLLLTIYSCASTNPTASVQICAFAASVTSCTTTVSLLSVTPVLPTL